MTDNDNKKQLGNRTLELHVDKKNQIQQPLQGQFQSIKQHRMCLKIQNMLPIYLLYRNLDRSIRD